MESGRIEPFRALPVHREAQPCLQPPLLGQIYTMYIDFPLDGNTPNPTLKSLKRRLGGLEASGGPWRPLEAPGGRPWRPRPLGLWSSWRPGRWNRKLLRRWRPGCWRPCRPAPANPPAAGPSFSWKEQEDDLFQVGIEGVALNPNREVIWVVACDVSQRVGVLKKALRRKTP